MHRWQLLTDSSNLGSFALGCPGNLKMNNLTLQVCSLCKCSLQVWREMLKVMNSTKRIMMATGVLEFHTKIKLKQLAWLMSIWYCPWNLRCSLHKPARLIIRLLFGYLILIQYLSYSTNLQIVRRQCCQVFSSEWDGAFCFGLSGTRFFPLKYEIAHFTFFMAFLSWKQFKVL